MKHVAVDRSTKNVLLISVVIVNVYTILSVADIINTYVEEGWINSMTMLTEKFSNILQLYVLLHHGILLGYIDNCLSKLNKQLECGEINNKFVYIYYQLTQVLQQANVLYGPPIFCVLFCIVLLNSMAGLTIMQFTKLYGFNEFIVLYLVSNGILLMCISAFLYFVICERVCKTARETRRIILEYSTTKPENKEVDMLFQQCLVMSLNINICRMFDLDLNAFFILLVGIFLNAIVLYQIEFGSELKHYSFDDYEFSDFSFSDFNDIFNEY
ncbi:hypothetical protein FF38_04253 [Lucilia cuprina]|uniref:Gustatory receptor n=1 Tax=Lucilia cuprina TaxID=7375 RepID=A0A0L0BYV7_LUCCU|nr:hypothetical protein FF38_04253 [Lucilia cuprina]